VIGFSVTLMGSIRPTIEFGILMMMMIFSALIANLFILPALLLSGKKRKKNAAV
jgi:predicted RND superfamily exporter protein